MPEAIEKYDVAYRRGLVLGLTMAEIMLLILFTLLLAIGAAVAFNEEKNRVAVAEAAAAAAAAEKEVKELKDIVSTLGFFTEQNGAGVYITDIISEIIRGSSETLTPQEIAEAIENARDLIDENENLRGQVEQLIRRLAALGGGNELPSCWVTSSGVVESIFEITITASGLVIKDRDLPHRSDNKLTLPIGGIPYEVILSGDDFETYLEPLGQWARDNECVFYAMRFSNVSDAPINLVNTVADAFYPDGQIRYSAIGP